MPAILASLLEPNWSVRGILAIVLLLWSCSIGFRSADADSGFRPLVCRLLRPTGIGWLLICATVGGALNLGFVTALLPDTALPKIPSEQLSHSAIGIAVFGIAALAAIFMHAFAVLLGNSLGSRRRFKQLGEQSRGDRL